MRDVVIVTASRLSEANFFRKTPLGISLGRIGLSKELRLDAEFSNSAGLPEVYNRRIRAEYRDTILLFVHDDIFIDDYWLAQRLNDASEQFDIVGLAGSSRILDEHIGWGFAASTAGLNWDNQSFLSGRVRHGDDVSIYGSSPKECKLLDGLFLGAIGEALIDHSISFDTIFNFHFYDLDFCRTCSAAELRIGTWPIAVTHSSGGSFGSPDWRAALDVYRKKWT